MCRHRHTIRCAETHTRHSLSNPLRLSIYIFSSIYFTHSRVFSTWKISCLWYAVDQVWYRQTVYAYISLHAIRIYLSARSTHVSLCTQYAYISLHAIRIYLSARHTHTSLCTPVVFPIHCAYLCIFFYIYLSLHIASPLKNIVFGAYGQVRVWKRERESTRVCVCVCVKCDRGERYTHTSLCTPVVWAPQPNH